MPNINQNVFKLNQVFDLINAGCWINYNCTPDPLVPGTLWGWGKNSAGELGQNNRVVYSSPIQIPGTLWRSFNRMRGPFSLSTKCDGTLWAWGCNAEGQLGDNTRTTYSSPVQIPGTQWCVVSAGMENISTSSGTTLALKTDNTLWGWGTNQSGEIGDNTVIRRSSPVQIPGTQWCFISSPGITNFGIKTDNTLWGWGCNNNGAIGDDSGSRRSSPSQVPGTQWCKVITDGKATSAFSLALKNDGTLWAWGSNSTYGMLGIPTNSVGSSSPMQIPGTSWCDINVGCQNSFALKTDGTFWAWGNNSVGQLGTNNTVHYSSPTQIPGSQWFRLGSTNDSAAAAIFGIKTDGTLWSWGKNNSGILGNNAIDTSSPTQVPGTQWYSVSGGSCSVIARKYV